MARKKRIDRQLADDAKMMEKNLSTEYKELCEVELDPPPEHRALKVGERCQIGNLDYSKVIEVCNGGRIYKILTGNLGTPYGRKNDFCELRIWYRLWVDCEKYQDYKKNPPKQEKYFVENDIRISYLNQDMHSLLHKIYNEHGGIDMNPWYQRGLVWDIHQKRELIHSIFNNIDIGKFTFVVNDFPYDYRYQVLDGKQRITAIREFYEDSFKYKGLYYSQLHPRDRMKFESHPIVLGETKKLTKEQILRYFLKLNTTGVPMSKDHMDMVYNMWLEEKEKENAVS